MPKIKMELVSLIVSIALTIILSIDMFTNYDLELAIVIGALMLLGCLLLELRDYIRDAAEAKRIREELEKRVK